MYTYAEKSIVEGWERMKLENFKRIKHGNEWKVCILSLRDCQGRCL
jgi:hypothetical protein